LVPAIGINEMDRVAAKRERFGGSCEMRGVDVPLSPQIRPLQRRRHQLHEVVHDHAPTFVWIEPGVSQPGVNAPGPLLHVQFGKGGTINPLQSPQHITDFSLGMAGNPTIGVHVIHASPKLPPHCLWLITDIFEWASRPAPCCDEAPSQRGVSGKGSLE
jgi:hypothetical protein